VNFVAKLNESIDRTGSLLCVGLDPDHRKLPPGMSQFELNKAIIDATADVASVFKPNPAFYEALGAEGVRALKDTCDYIRRVCPGTPILVDAKRGDIGNTNEALAEYVFDYLGADAITLHPYFGKESLQTFLRREDKGIIILCRSSNPGGSEFQDLAVDGQKLYQRIARRVVEEWNDRGNCLLMVGATWPEELAEMRRIAGPDMPFLVPGTGPQGGNARAAVRAGLGAQGRGLMLNASRAIMFAGSGPDMANKARAAALALRDEINGYRQEVVVRQMLVESGGWLENDHFVFTNGNHSDNYINKDALYPHTEYSSRLGEAMAQAMKPWQPEVVVSPALGGIVLTQWAAHHASRLLGREVLAVYAEKVDGPEKFAFTRGYDALVRGRRVAVLEDNLTTGKSVRRVVELVRATGGEVVGVVAMLNRGGVDKAAVGNPPEFIAIVETDLKSWPAEECELCRRGVPVNLKIAKGKKFVENLRNGGHGTIV
jgi:orotidine-5'-phosphate decarboxylase